MEWDWTIELDTDPVTNPIRFTDKGLSYPHVTSLLDQDVVEYLIDVKSPEEPLTGPLELNLFFYLARENRRSKLPYNYEYIDQLSIFIETMCEGRLYKNKKQICRRLQVKEYADGIHPRVIILVRKLSVTKNLSILQKGTSKSRPS